jgi:hypothetical protein
MLFVTGRQVVPVTGQSFGAVQSVVSEELLSQRQIERQVLVVPIRLHSRPAAQSALLVQAPPSWTVWYAVQVQST